MYSLIEAILLFHLIFKVFCLFFEFCGFFVLFFVFFGSSSMEAKQAERVGKTLKHEENQDRKETTNFG